MAIFTTPLTWIILLPVLGAVAVYLTPEKVARWLALLFAVATFAVSVVVLANIGSISKLAASSSGSTTRWASMA